MQIYKTFFYFLNFLLFHIFHYFQVDKTCTQLHFLIVLLLTKFHLMMLILPIIKIKKKTYNHDILFHFYYPFQKSPIITGKSLSQQSNTTLHVQEICKHNCNSITLSIDFLQLITIKWGVWFDVYFLCCSIPVQTIFEAHPNGCAAIAMSPDAKYIATISSTLPQVISIPTCPKWITKCNFGKISAQPSSTIVKQSLSIKGSPLLLPLFSLSKNCICNEVYNSCING